MTQSVKSGFGIKKKKIHIIVAESNFFLIKDFQFLADLKKKKARKRQKFKIKFIVV